MSEVVVAVSLDSTVFQNEILNGLRERAAKGASPGQLVDYVQANLEFSNLTVPMLGYFCQAFSMPLVDVLPLREWCETRDDQSISALWTRLLLLRNAECMQKLWRLGDLEESRKQRLTAECPLFEELVDCIQAARVVGLMVEEGRNTTVNGCKRPIYKIVIGRELFDQFFNGINGYRAQFCYGRLDADLRVIDKLKTSLLDYFDQMQSKGFVFPIEKEYLEKSLEGRSAKVWFDDDEYTPGCLDVDQAELKVTEWSENAKQGDVRARKGLNAFQGNILAVKGSFVDHDGNERVSPDKEHRALNLARYGFV